MTKRAALLATLEQRFGAEQVKTGIFQQPGVDLEGVPTLHPTELESVPEMLNKARMDAKLTLAEVAERLGVTRAAVHHRERAGANIEVATLLEQAQALGYEVSITLRHLESGQVLTTRVV